MKFFAGMALGAVLVACAGLYLINQIENEPVRFPRYQLMDLGDYVRLEGSVVGDQDDPVNNFYSIHCYQDQQQCKIASINEIGNNQPGTFVEETIPVTQWNDASIRMSSKDLTAAGNACNFYEIAIDREADTATYTRRPFEGAPEDCSARYDEKVMRWRFDNGPAWGDNADGSDRT